MRVVPYYGEKACESGMSTHRTRAESGPDCSTKRYPTVRVVPQRPKRSRGGTQGVSVTMSISAHIDASHVLLTTYEVVTGADFCLMSGVPRWEALIVDEGQRRESSI